MDIVGIFREIQFSALFLYFCLEKKKNHSIVHLLQFRTSRLQAFFVQLFPGKISAYATNYTLCSFPRSKIGQSFATILTTFGRQYQHCIRNGWPNICNKNKLVKSTSALVNFFCFIVFFISESIFYRKGFIRFLT